MNENYTNPQIPQPYYEEDDIDIMELLLKLLRNWKFIFKWGVLGVVAGLIIALSLQKSYTVTSVLAPEITQKSGGSLSSLAAMAGINLGSATGTDAMYPDLYPEIVNSVPFKVALFDIPVTVKTGDGPVETDLFTYLAEYGKQPWWSYIISLPMRGLSWVLSLTREKEQEDEGYTQIDPTRLTSKQEKIVKALGRSIVITVDKKTYLIHVDVTMQDPVVAQQVCEQVVDKLQTYVVKYRTEKTRMDVDYYTTLNDEAREDYFKAQQKYANYVDANQGIARQSVRIEQERLQNESSLAFSLYNQTAQQLQVAKARLQQETPICVVIQPPVVPHKGAPSRAKVLVIVTFLFGACAALWVLWGKDLLNQLITSAKKDDEDKDKRSESK